MTKERRINDGECCRGDCHVADGAVRGGETGMKEYKYHGFVFRPTTTMTEVYVLNRSRCYTTKLVPLYEIDGLKECGKHPLLTTIAECKEYIRLCEEEKGK